MDARFVVLDVGCVAAAGGGVAAGRSGIAGGAAAVWCDGGAGVVVPFVDGWAGWHGFGGGAAVIVAGVGLSRWHVGAAVAFVGGAAFAAADVGTVGVVAVVDHAGIF